MAFGGTIKDFGVGEILQLVGQQAKTGILEFENDLDKVGVYFRDGSIVHAERATQTSDRMLGGLLVGAEIITQGQLDQALTEQKRTLQRLGQVLLDLRYVDAETLTEFATLQLTETLYGLFEWTDGRYHFNSERVEPSNYGVKPMKAESVVLNGVRAMDEWPDIRDRIPSYLWVVEKTRELPGLTTGDLGPRSGLEDAERRVFELIGPGRRVQKIIDLSRMGEFETCQALSVLMQAGFVRVIKPAPTPTDDDAEGGPSTTGSSTVRIVGRMAVSALTVVLAAFLLASTSRSLSEGGRRTVFYRPDPVAGHLADAQIKVLRRALEVYRFQTGSYPPSLDELVEGRFIRPRDVRYPFTRRYFYRVNEQGEVVVLPPVR